MLDFSVAPYYDDFDQTKHFHKVLFRPGRSVQARELNQAQSILQDQISKFADHIFVKNTPISGGNISLKKDSKMLILEYNHEYEEGEETLDVSVFLNKIVVNSDSTVVAKVIAVEDVVLTDENIVENHPGLVLVYNTANQFKEKDVVYLYNNNLFRGYVREKKDVYTVSINDGVYYIINGHSFSDTPNPDGSFSKYTLGHFVKVDSQTILVSKEQNPSVKVGLSINEHFIDHVDEPSLLDPALGASNYQAPGADRFTINLILESRNITDNEEDFIELLRIKNGSVISATDSTRYKELDDYLAKRTFETNGDFVVDEFSLKALPIRSKPEKFNVEIGKGLAYVNGYRILNKYPFTLEVDKARTSKSVDTKPKSISYGNYFLLQEGFTLKSHNFEDFPYVDLYFDTTKTLKIGTTRIRNISRQDTTYKLFVVDIDYETITGTLTKNTTGYSITLDSISNTLNFSEATITVNQKNYLIGSKDSDDNYQIQNLNATNNTRFSLKLDSKTIKTIYRPNVIDANINIDPNKSGLQSTNNNNLVFKISSVAEEIESISDVSYSYYTAITVTAVSGVLTIQDVVEQDKDIIVLDSSYKNINNTISINNSGEDSVIKSNNSTPLSGTYYILHKTTDSSSNAIAAKTLVKYNENTNESGEPVNLSNIQKFVEDAGIVVLKNITPTNIDQVFSLYVSDVLRIKKMILSSGGAINELKTNSDDIKSHFDFNNGQRNSYYDHATIKCKNTQYIKTKLSGKSFLIVGFDYFKPNGNGVFCANSYKGVERSDIPKYNNVSLANCIDFRPVRENMKAVFDIPTGAKIPISGSQFIYKKNSYLPRKDLIVLDKGGTFSVTKGIEALEPVFPNMDSGTLLIGKMSLDAYTYDVAKNVQIELVRHKRWTMEEITKINSRVSTLEYYTTLSMAEQNTKNQQIIDSTGQNRIKNGIFVDGFTDFNRSDLSDTDFSASIDDRLNVMTAKRNVEKFIFDKDQSVTNYIKTHKINGGITNLYTLTFSTSTIDSDGKSTTNYVKISHGNADDPIGIVELSPSMDNWFDFGVKPTYKTEVIVPDKFDSVIFPFMDWKKVVGVETVNNSNTFEKNDNIEAFVRPQHILIKCNGFKKGGAISVSIGNEDVSNYIHKLNVIKSPNANYCNVIGTDDTESNNYVIDYGYTHERGGQAITTYENYYTGRVASLSQEFYKIWVFDAPKINRYTVKTNNTNKTDTFSIPSGDYVLNYYFNKYSTGTKIELSVNATSVSLGPFTMGDLNTMDFGSTGGTANITLTLTGTDQDRYLAFWIHRKGDENDVVYSSNELLESSNSVQSKGGGSYGEVTDIYLDSNYNSSIGKADAGDDITITGTKVNEDGGVESFTNTTKIRTVDGNKITLKTPLQVSVGYNVVVGDICSVFTINSASKNVTNSKGDFYGVLQIPQKTFNVGDQNIVVTVEDSDGSVVSTENAVFFSKTLYGDKTKSSEYSPSVDGNYDNFVELSSKIDPIAQTFKIPKNTYDNGVMVTSVTVWVKNDDAARQINGTLVVKLVNVVNGKPEGVTIDYSTKSVYVSLNKSETKKSVTFDFQCPVFLKSNTEYGLLLYSTDNDISVKVNGENKENEIFVLFYGPKNAKQWKGEQNKHIVMDINICDFNDYVGNDYTFDLKLSPTLDTKKCLISSSNHYNTFYNKDYPINALNISSTDYAPPGTSLSYTYSLSAPGETPLVENVQLGKYATPKSDDIRFTNSTQRYINSYFSLKPKFKTNSRYVSPIISDDGLNVFGIQYIINNLELNESQFNIVTDNDVLPSPSNSISLTFKNKNPAGGNGTGILYANGEIIILNSGHGFVEKPIIITATGNDISDSVPYIGETSSTGGNALCKYISKTITLPDIGSSADLKVYCTAYRPVGTNIYVMYKIRSKDDNTEIGKNDWQLMYMVRGNDEYSSNIDDVNDYEFSIDSDIDYINTTKISYKNINGSIFDDFVEYKMKVILTTNNKNFVPHLTNLRTIALPEY